MAAELCQEGHPPARLYAHRTTQKVRHEDQGRSTGRKPVILAAARAKFDTDMTYLDTVTFGLPPRRSWTACQQALMQWRAGTAAAYDLLLAAARSSNAHLARVDPSA